MDKIDRSHNALDLLTKMLEDDPDKRISSEEVAKELEAIKIKVDKKEELFKKNNLDRNKIKFLFQNGIDVNEKDKNGRNALHTLCESNSSEKLIDKIQFLIQNGIDVNGRDKYGKNALHFLCEFNSSEKLTDAMQFLIQNGIDVNGKDEFGKNALDFLCLFNSSEKKVDAIRLLMDHGIQSQGIKDRRLLRKNKHYRNKTEPIEEITHLLHRTAITK